MDFRQDIQKANVACFSSRQHTADSFTGIAEMVTGSRQLGLRRRNVRYVGLPSKTRVSDGWALRGAG